MIRKTPSNLPGHINVTFELPSCVWASRIFLVGEFNNWQAQNTPLTQQRDGTWRVTLDLPVGRVYEFRYLIDGQWQTDSHADGYSSSDSNAQNSIVNTQLFNWRKQVPESVPVLDTHLFPTVAH